MVEELDLTNKQFQGFVRLILGAIERALELSPDNVEIISLKETLSLMLEES